MSFRSNRTVIGFDGWTKGIHHYERLVEAFAKRNIELKLIHIGSWGNETGRAASESIGKVLVRDVSFYAPQTLSMILSTEKPAAVILLSTEAFAHRAFMRYCRKAHVPTVHLFHGLHGAVNFEDDVDVSVFKRLWRLRGHIPKLILHAIPAYLRSLLATAATWDEWKRLGFDIVSRFAGRMIHLAATDSKADRACVYTHSEVQYAKDRYGYADSEVSAVGNPDLIHFGMSEGLMGSALRSPRLAFLDVMYIDSGLLDCGIVYESVEAFIDHIVNTHRQLSRQGKRLILKPHYVHVGTRMLDDIRHAGVQICSNETFIPKLQGCCASIVEPSTAALIPALMGLPLFLAQYGNLGSRRFGRLLTEYPRMQRLNDLQHFSALLSEEEAMKRQDIVQQWIDCHVGPLPADHMPERVADVVVGLMK